MDRLHELFLNWYDNNQRVFPWRNQSDPYKIWLSEIILQQTRANQGLVYYKRFLDKWPSVELLSLASEHDVLKMWQGLGYYSRARNLLKCAKQIVNEFDGVFPSDFDQLKNLKGIGDYTASAIISMAFGKPYAVVDGNVFRVLSRLFDVEIPINAVEGKRAFSELAQKILYKKDPGKFNQAVMEFGALYCIPKNPDCPNCIFKNLCLAFKNNKINKLPVKTKTIRPKTRYFNYLFFVIEKKQERFTYLKKRIENDIWQNLYDFPLIETNSQISFSELVQEKNFLELAGKNSYVIKVSQNYTHQLTHQKIQARFFCVELTKPLALNRTKDLSLVKISEIDNFPLPRLMEKYLNDMKMNQ